MPWPPPRDLPNLCIEATSLMLPVDSLLSEPPGKPKNIGVGSLSLLLGNLPNPGLELGSLALQVDSGPAEPPGSLLSFILFCFSFRLGWVSVAMHRFFVSEHGLSRCSRGGGVVVLSCFTACGILVPPPWEGGFLAAGPPGKSPHSFFCMKYYLSPPNHLLFILQGATKMPCLLFSMPCFSRQNSLFPNLDFRSSSHAHFY